MKKKMELCTDVTLRAKSPGINSNKHSQSFLCTLKFENLCQRLKIIITESLKSKSYVYTQVFSCLHSSSPQTHRIT